MAEPGFDVAAAHQHFSTECFNRTWALIDKPDRNADENELMLLHAMSSMWHWIERPECTPTTRAAGYWLISRVHALRCHVEEARRYALLSLEAAQSEGVEPFYEAYAYEALGRAEYLAGWVGKARGHVQKAREMADAVGDEESRNLLLADLETIG